MKPEDQIITFETYYDPMLAHIIRTKLEDAGIKCFIADETSITLNPIYNQALNGIKLKIFAYDLERCKAIVAADDALNTGEHVETDPDTDDVFICPYCASSNVQYGMPKPQKPGLSGFLSSFFAAVFPFNRKQWYCLNCHRDFE